MNSPAQYSLPEMACRSLLKRMARRIKNERSLTGVRRGSNLGSMNKMFTAAAIAQLAQEGRLQVSDTVGHHLPDYPNNVVARRVTIHHLLTHTSGLGDYLSSRDFGRLRGELKNVTSHFPLFIKEPLSFEPGTRFQYSNAGYVVLGAIIERVTGQSYFDYVREHIFRPAGMNDTDSFDLEQNIPNLAFGYTKPSWSGTQSRKENTSMLPFKGSPAGGGYSTLDDLLRFDRALRGYKLLNKQFTDLIFNSKVDTNLATGGSYGYGFREQRICGHRLVGHTGGYVGISAVFQMYLDQDYTVVVLSNYDERAAQVVGRRARELIAGK